MSEAEAALIWLAVPSELGDLALVASPDGLAGLLLPRRGPLAQAVHDRWRGARRGTAPVLALFEQELRLYLAGGRPGFPGPLDLRGASEYERAVYEVTRTIPHGETRTYGWVAERAGGSAQAVGNALGKNPIPIVVPCHRVVAAGSLGGFTGGLPLKRALLQLEGAAPHGQTELPLTTERRTVR
jgi:methylated-DNA-[protein]-cysteine S-methyltransferase